MKTGCEGTKKGEIKLSEVESERDGVLINRDSRSERMKRPDQGEGGSVWGYDRLEDGSRGRALIWSVEKPVNGAK
jgi:hypothetical protein